MGPPWKARCPLLEQLAPAPMETASKSRNTTAQGDKLITPLTKVVVCIPSQCGVHIVVGPWAKGHSIHAGSPLDPKFFFFFLPIPDLYLLPLLSMHCVHFKCIEYVSHDKALGLGTTTLVVGRTWVTKLLKGGSKNKFLNYRLMNWFFE
jgi:hypothetical protein